MKISILKHRFVSPDGVRNVEMSWEELYKHLSTPVYTPCVPCKGKDCLAKKDTVCWSPATYRNNVRGNANVESVSCLVYDLDDLTPEAFDTLLARLSENSVAALVVATHNYKPDAPRARLVLKIDRDCIPSEYTKVWPGVMRKFGIPGDPVIKETDTNRIFFGSTIPEGSEFFAEDIPGNPISVDAFLQNVVTPTTPVVQSLPLDDIDALIKRKLPSIYEVVHSNDGIAPQGQQDTTINEFASKVVFALPVEAAEDAIYQFFRPCLNMTKVNAGDEEWPHEKMKLSIKRAKERLKEEIERKTQERALRDELMRTLSAQADDSEDTQTEKYSSEQLEKWAMEQGCNSVEEFTRRWIIHKGASYYVFVNGKYKAPISKDDLQNAFQIDFARAPFSVTKQAKNGEVRPISFKELLDNHGRVARRIEASLALQSSYYDAKTETFFEAACPRRNIVAKFHREIHEWLHLLGPKVVDWVAAVTRLEKQCAALYLVSKPNSGKTLLATGLARIWTEGGATPMDSIIHNFNDRLRRCPLVLADESLPNVGNKSTFVRQFIGNTQHNLNEKYRSAVNLSGSPRVIIAANNNSVFDTSEELNLDDLAAYAERIIHVQVPDAVGEYLAGLIQKGVVINDWIEKDMMAEHAIWLRENHTIKPGKRYIVSGELTNFHRHLAINSGIAAYVSEWVSRKVVDLSNGSDVGQKLVRVGNGKILVSPGAIGDDFNWRAYLPSVKMPAVAKISKTLRQLSVGTVEIDGMVYFEMDAEIVRHQIMSLALGNVRRAIAFIEREHNDTHESQSSGRREAPKSELFTN